jgi:hypothetical protein
MSPLLIEILHSEDWVDSDLRSNHSEHPLVGAVVCGDGNRIAFDRSTVIVEDDRPKVLIQNCETEDEVKATIAHTFKWGPDTLSFVSGIAMDYDVCIVTECVLADPFVRDGLLLQPIVARVKPEDYVSFGEWAEKRGLT